MVAVQQLDERTSQLVSVHRLRQQCPALAVADGAAADDHFDIAERNRFDDPGQLAGVVAEVTIEEDDNVGWVLGEKVETGEARCSVSTLGLVDDDRPTLPRDLGRAVGAPIVDDHDAPHPRFRDFGEHEGKALLLVQRGNQHINLEAVRWDEGPSVGPPDTTFAAVREWFLGTTQTGFSPFQTRGCGA